MTVDTAVKIEGEKCRLDMTSSCEDLPPSCVGGGGGECNGDGKDDYVFVNGSDDDHGEIEGNAELNVSASNAVLEGKIEEVGLNVIIGGDQLETCNGYSGKLDNVVKVNGGKVKLENGVVEEEEKDGKVEIKSENEDVIQDGDVVVGSSDTKDADCQIDVKDRNLDFVEGSDVDIKVQEGESGVEKGDESNASVDHIGHPSLDDDDKENNLQGIDSVSDVVQNGTTIVEAEPLVPHVEIEEQLHLGQSEEHENQVKELEKPEEGIMKHEVVADNVDSHIAEGLVTDSEPVDGIITESKPLEAEPLVPHVESEEQLHHGRSEEENQDKELEKPEEGIMKSEVVEDNVSPHIAEVLVTDSGTIDGNITELKPLEADVKRESQGDGIIESQPTDDNFKAPDSEIEKLEPDNAMTEKQFQQQELQPDDIREAGPVKAEAEVRELGDIGTSGMSGSQDLNSVDTKAAVCELHQTAESEVKDQDASELTTEPEECQELQAVPESEGLENHSSLELITSEVDRPVLQNSEQSDEATIELAADVNGIPEPSTEVVRPDYSDKSAVDQEPDRVHGEGKSELTAQLGGSFKSLVEEGSHQDQVEEVTGLVDVIDKEVYSEDLTSEKIITSDEATNHSVPKAANEAVVDEEGQDLDASHLGDGMAEKEVHVSESSHDSGGCLRPEDADLNVPVCNEVDSPGPCDSDVRGVIVEDESCAGDNDISSSADEYCHPSKLESCDNALQKSVNGANLEVKPVNGEVDVASKTNRDFQDISEPKISFGSFECAAPFSQNDNIHIQTDVLNRSTELIASHSDFVGNSESIVDTANGASSLGSGANDVLSTELGHDKSSAGVVSLENSTEEVSASVVEGSAADSSDGQNVNPDLVRRPFYYLIRIPRFDDVTLSEQIKQSEEEVQKKTQIRDDVRTEYQNRKAIYWEIKTNFEAAKSEERAAHRLLIAKKREIDSAQSLINLAKNAVTVEDVDSQILNMERRIQHETLDLAEEKRLVREIKQCNRQREQLVANTRRQQELQQAKDQRVEKEEHLKILRKEIDALRDNHAKAEECFKAAKKRYDEESTLLNDLKVRFTSADDIRQEAYARLQTLKKQAFDKNKLFYNYKDAAKAANDLVVAGKKDSLEQHCVNQVEKIMELWNKNDEFRKEYIRCNQRSTLRRFKTLDGRSLGPDEEQPSLGNFSDNRVNGVAKAYSVSTVSTLERDFPLIAKNEQEDSSKKATEQKNKIALGKKRAETTSKDSLAEPSGRMEIEAKKKEEEAKEEAHKLTKEEEELARKEEQKRREEEAVLLREKRREEEKAKAQEAQERKKRMAEKAQARAEFKARKAAEEKEKEREKRAKKKQKKKGIVLENTEIEPAQLPESSPSETIREPEVSEKPVTVTKKSHKPVLYTKQVKSTKSISAPPAPLRNRGKRRVPQWVWWLIVAILSVILIFPLGNIDIVGRFRQFTSGPSQ